METAEDRITGNNVCCCAFDADPQILQAGGDKAHHLQRDGRRADHENP